MQGRFILPEEFPPKADLIRRIRIETGTLGKRLEHLRRNILLELDIS
jgi:hypothetical protein